jgi:hypothetical protein
MTVRIPHMAAPLAAPLAVLAALALAGCSIPVGRPSGLTAAQAQACRQRTDEVYLLQNRGELYRTDSFVSGSRDSPFSGATGVTTSGGIGANNFGDGLSGQYAREKALSDCYNSSAGPAATKP